MLTYQDSTEVLYSFDSWLLTSVGPLEPLLGVLIDFFTWCIQLRPADSILLGLRRKIEESGFTYVSRVERSLILVRLLVVDFCWNLPTIAWRSDRLIYMVHSTEAGGFNFARIATKNK